VAKDNKHLAKFVAEHQLPGETVIAHVSAFREGKGLEGAAILTDKRFVFIRAGMLSDKIEPWPLSKISSLEGRKGLINYSLKAYTSGDDLELLIVGDKAGAAAFVRAAQEAIHAPAAPGSDDPMEQLGKLGELRDAGVLSEDEFAEKKTALLARI